MNAASVARPLPAPECLRLLASAPVGRIVYSRNALPAVEPVRFTLDSGHIFAAVGAGSAMLPSIDQSIVAFQADQIADGQDQWTVTVVGDVLLVTDGDEIGKLRGQGLTSWTPSGRDQFLRIRPGIVTGQRLWLAARGYPPHQFGT